MQKTYTLGSRTFVLDQAKAEAALAAKRVVGGRETMTFNLLPLRYGWAYELYRTMKANHWEPEDVPMARDVEQWREILKDPGAKLHLYGKAEARPGRKMGHVTRLSPKS